MNLIEEFISKNIGNGGCWIWTGNFHKKWKKPCVGKKKNLIWVHRYVFEKFYKKIPAKGMIYRSCWTDRCCQPKHLYLIMPGEMAPTRDNDVLRQKQKERDNTGEVVFIQPERYQNELERGFRLAMEKE